jgi:ketosteroid isomerase-like protein
MSDENVEIVRKAIEAGNRRDVAMQRALWRSDAEVDWSRSNGPLKGVYRGREEIENFQNEFWSTFEKGEIEAHEFTQAGSDRETRGRAARRGRAPRCVRARPTDWCILRPLPRGNHLGVRIKPGEPGGIPLGGGLRRAERNLAHRRSGRETHG